MAKATDRVAAVSDRAAKTIDDATAGEAAAFRVDIAFASGGEANAPPITKSVLICLANTQGRIA